MRNKIHYSIAVIFYLLSISSNSFGQFKSLLNELGFKKIDIGEPYESFSKIYDTANFLMNPSWSDIRMNPQKKQISTKDKIYYKHFELQPIYEFGATNENYLSSISFNINDQDVSFFYSLFLKFLGKPTKIISNSTKCTYTGYYWIKGNSSVSILMPMGEESYIRFSYQFEQFICEDPNNSGNNYQQQVYTGNDAAYMMKLMLYERMKENRKLRKRNNKKVVKKQPPKKTAKALNGFIKKISN